jgi:acetone carboxylase gamma subunit
MNKIDPTANNFDRKRNEMIVEGFICPECQQDMTSIELLTAHFQLVHSKVPSNSAINTNTNNDAENSEKSKILSNFVFKHNFKN